MLFITSTIMIGLPTEGLEDILELGNLINEVEPNYVLSNYYGFHRGGDRKSESKVFTLKNSGELHNQTELAESYGITKQTMNNYMRMASMLPELEDLVDK